MRIAANPLSKAAPLLAIVLDPPAEQRVADAIPPGFDMAGVVPDETGVGAGRDQHIVPAEAGQQSQDRREHRAGCQVPVLRNAGVVVEDGYGRRRRSDIGYGHGDATENAIVDALNLEIARRFAEAARRPAEEAVRTEDREIIIGA